MATESNGAERVPPQAVEVEAAVLGAMLLDQEGISAVQEIIDDTAFYRDAHRKIYNAIVALYERNEPTDLLTLTTELNKRQQISRCRRRILSGRSGRKCLHRREH